MLRCLVFTVLVALSVSAVPLRNVNFRVDVATRRAVVVADDTSASQFQHLVPEAAPVPGAADEWKHDAVVYEVICDTPRGELRVASTHTKLASGHLFFETADPVAHSAGRLSGGVRPPYDAHHRHRDRRYPDNDRYDYVAAGVPADATRVTLRHRRLGTEHHHRPAARSMTSQATTTLTALSTGGSVSQVTVVFVSGGYTDQIKFNSAVTRMMNVLRGLDGSVDAGPYARYYSLLDVYSIYEPGNTLGCTRWTPGQAEQPHRLSCDYASVQTLANNGPQQRDVVVVLYDSAEYGGTGGQGMAVLSAENSLAPFLLVHEMNHALAGLGDEYSYGYSDTTEYNLPNCGAASTVAQSKWSAWAGTANIGAFPACSFTNLFRPTDDSCLMRSRGRPMCPVCAEAVTIALRRKRVSNVATSLATPTCPQQDFEVELLAAQKTTLTLNHRFLTQPGVSVVWSLPDSTTVTGLTSYIVQGGSLTTGANTFTAVVTDTTNGLVKDPTATGLFVSNVTFTVSLVTAPSAAAETKSCTASTGVSESYVGRCTDTVNNCTTPVTVEPKDVLPESYISIEVAQGIVIVVALLTVVVGVGVIVFIIVLFIIRHNHEPAELLVYGYWEKVVWFVAMAVLFIAFLLCCALIAVLVWGIDRIPEFALAVYIALLVISGLVYFVVGFTLCAVAAWWYTLMLIGGIVVTVMSLGVFAACAIAAYFVTNSKSESLTDDFRTMWRDAVKDRPEYVCAVQNLLDCSGFDETCLPLPGAYCPPSCEVANMKPRQCLTEWQDFVADTLRPLAGVGLTFAFALLVGGALAIIFYVVLQRIRGNAVARRRFRSDPRGPMAPLTRRELAALEREFHKADKNGDGALGENELVKFVRAVFPNDDISLAEEAQLRAAATDDDGNPIKLSLDEVLDLLFPTRHRKQDPRLLTAAEAEGAANMQELVRRQDQKMERYMTACGALSPEQLSLLYNHFLDTHPDDDAAPAKPFERAPGSHASDEFFELVRLAAAEHADSEDAKMCRGLTAGELEGLRCQWVELHPDVHGPLTDTEIDRMYSLTHNGEKFASVEHAGRWRDMLDVRHNDVIGWPEFCFPFAQRALLRQARQTLADLGIDVIAEFGQEGESAQLTRDEVAQQYDQPYVECVFLPNEEAVPVERPFAVQRAAKLEAPRPPHASVSRDR